MRMPLRLQALFAFFKHYADVFAHAWKFRAFSAPKGYTSEEAAFLPATLELQESPVSPLPRVAMWLLILFCALAITWACLGKVDVVSVASGKIIPHARTKSIQPLEISVVKEIWVHDGQEVKTGDVLIEFDPAQVLADIQKYETAGAFVKLQLARSDAMVKSIDTGKLNDLQVPEGAPAKEVARTQTSLREQYAEYIGKRNVKIAEQNKHEKELTSEVGACTSKLNIKSAERTKHEKELISMDYACEKIETMLPFFKQRVDDYEALAKEGQVGTHDMEDKKRAYAEQKADLAELKSKREELKATINQTQTEIESIKADNKSRCEELKAAIEQTQAEIESIKAETRRLALDVGNENRPKLNEAEQELSKAQTRLALHTLHAPIDGTVQQLALHTKGGVATPAQVLMLIVPKEETIEVEATIENKDIGFVYEGQEALAKIEAFPYSRYGTIDAKITSVSKDAVLDEKRGLLFTIHAELAKNSIRVEGKDIPLSAGMTVTIEAKSKQRRIIGYFLAPLIETTSESLHER